jgi:accessory gene regulator protein AgrB
MEKLSMRLAVRLKTEETPYSVGQLAHGIEIVLQNILHGFALVVTAALFGQVREVILVSFLFFIHRLFSGGVHLKSPWTCLAATLTLMNAGGYLVKSLSETPPSHALWPVGIGLAIAFLVNYRYAPVEHTYFTAQPRIKRVNRSIILIMVLFGCTLSLFLVEYAYQIAVAYTVAVLLQSLLLLPVSFQLASQLDKIVERMRVK